MAYQSFLISNQPLMIVKYPGACYPVANRDGWLMSKLIDLTGKRFGEWIVLNRDTDIKCKGGNALWACKCSCGKTKTIKGNHLKRGASKSCGCKVEGKFKNKRFGNWTVIRKAEKEERKVRLGNSFLCRCECGTERIVTRGALISGTSKSCGCSRHKTIEEIGVNGLYDSYKRGANKRGLEFSITKDFFQSLIKSNCLYCGKEPSQKFRGPELLKHRADERRVFVYTGIDRINPKLGYVNSNCVPCCKICNSCKWNMMQGQWICHMKKILNRHDSGLF